MTYKFYDTSAIINNIDTVFAKSKAEHFQIMLSSVTIEELEHLKATDRAGANHVLRVLEANFNNYNTVLAQDKYFKKYSNKYKFTLTNDLRIILSAYCFQKNNKNCDVKFITDDLAQRAFAQCFFPMSAIESSTSIVETAERYKGYKEIILSDNELADFYSNLTINQFNLLVNEYLIIYNNNNEMIDCYCWTGETHRPISYPNLKSMYFGPVKAYKDDVYQRLTLDSFVNNTITMVSGAAGTGKSYLALAYLFSQLEHGAIDRIVIFVIQQWLKMQLNLVFIPERQSKKFWLLRLEEYYQVKLAV